MADPDTTLETRQGFQALNPIPGDRWEQDLIENANENGRPENYNAANCLDDKRAYIERVGNGCNELLKMSSKYGNTSIYTVQTRLETQCGVCPPAVLSAHANESNNVPSEEPASSAHKKRSGKQPNATQQLNFRMKTNESQAQEVREAVTKSLGVFDQTTAEVEQAIESLIITVQPVAIPLPAASRGVGFTAVAEYSRMVSAWDGKSVHDLCTIFQYYRVELNLFYFKLFHARYAQNERESFPLNQPFVFDDLHRQILQSVNQVPFPFYNVICSLGKIEGSITWNTFPVLEAPNTAEQAACYVYPVNISQTLAIMADPDTPLQMRQGFRALNPIPGVRWEQDLIANANDVWPENYNAANLLDDTLAYRNLLTRAGNRLPKSFLFHFNWTSTASKTGTTCMYPVQTRLAAQWRVRPPATQRGQRRGPDGELVSFEQMLPQHEYITDVMHNILTVVEVWSPEHEITGKELTMGAASFVGECARYATRLQVNGRMMSAVSPGAGLYKMVDAPRS